jgi:hypothetical protein
MPENRRYVHVFTLSREIEPRALDIDGDPLPAPRRRILRIDSKVDVTTSEFMGLHFVRTKAPDARWYLYGYFAACAASRVYLELRPTEAGDLLIELDHGDKLTEDITGDPDWLKPRPGAHWIRPTSQVSSSQGIDSDEGRGPAPLDEGPAGRIAAPSVVLGELKDRPKIRGVEVPRLSRARYDVVRALLAVWPETLNKDELVARSGHGGAVGILKALKQNKKSPEWASAIDLPGERGVGYRIADA